MKSKFLLAVLIGVFLVSSMVMVSCKLFRCPGDGSSGGKDNCHYTYGASTYYQCSNDCISDQGVRISGTTYSFSSSKSCDCSI